MQTCSICSIKSTNFNKKQSRCKDCQKIYNRNYHQSRPKTPSCRKIPLQSPEERILRKKLRAKKYYENNKKIIQAKSKQKNYTIEQINKRKEYKKKWALENKERTRPRKNENQKRRRQNLHNKLRDRISKLIHFGLSKNNSYKNTSSWNCLTYSVEQLKQHIEKLFEPWMNWNNWGVYRVTTWDENDSSTWTWQLDHIIPHSDLPYSSMEDENFKKCWALENLRPLSSKLNVIEGTTKIRHKK